MPILKEEQGLALTKQTPSVKQLLEAGAHFGHQKRRWNPRMERFILQERNGIYIIDLAKTVQQIREALDVVEGTIKKGQSILFVGTKKQARDVVRDCAEKCGEYYICDRWLGGTLTNLVTIRQSIKKLERIEKQIAAGGEGLTKKELSLLTKLQIKLERNLGGIRTLKRPPGLLVVVDPDREAIAVAEAKKLGIPVMALVDTNCNPDPIDYVIACNDDALKSIKLIIDSLATVVVDKKTEMQIAIHEKGEEEPEEEESKDEVAIEEGE